MLRKLKSLSRVDKTFYLGGKSEVSPDLIADYYAYIGPGCWICPNVSLGKYTMLAPQVYILGGDHSIDRIGIPCIFSERPTVPKTIIGDDVWIGARATISAGITIGDGSIVGAGAVVTKSIAPNSIVAGVPAKFIRKRFESDSDFLSHLKVVKTRNAKVNLVSRIKENNNVEG